MAEESIRDRSHEISDYSDLDILDDEDESDEADPVAALQQAEESSISRKRSFQRTSLAKSASTSAAKKACKVSHGASTRLVKVKPQARVQEFPEEMLIESSGKLYCEACHIVVSVKKSIVQDHIVSDRHARGKEARRNQLQHQQRVAESWEAYQNRHVSRLSGTGLTEAVSTDEALARIETVRAFLKAGIPLAKAGYLRPLLESGSSRLTDPSHLGSYIPFIRGSEAECIKEELKGSPHISVIFDGSTYHGEALAVLVRFVDSNFDIVQRLVRVHILAKTLSGQQLAREIITVLSTELQLPSTSVLAAIRDGASVNASAVQKMRDILYPEMMDIICISHSLDNVGKRIDTPLLDTFQQWWIALFAHSLASKLAWKTHTGQAIKTYSRTRWWSWWEVLVQLEEKFEDVLPFLRSLESSPTICRHLLNILEDEEQRRDLRLQLAVTVDAGKPFVTGTYLLEGDGEAIVTAHRQLQEISTAAFAQHYPKVRAVVQQLAGHNQAAANALLTTAEDCVAPAIRYFRERFNKQGTAMYEIVRLFKSMRAFCPVQATELRLSVQDVEGLRILPVLDNDDTIAQLQEELPAYLVAAAEAVIDDASTRLQWW